MDNAAETAGSTTVPPTPNAVWGNLLKAYAGTHYEYDQRGNLTRKTHNGEITHYHWNGYNQLIRIENKNGATEYRYDPLGRRITKTRNGHTTVYLWQEDTLAVETANGQSTHYLFEPDSFEPLAQFQTAAVEGIPSPSRIVLPYSYDPDKDPLLQEPAQPETQPELVYYHLDHLGTPIAAGDENGKTVWQATYKAWGEITGEKVSDRHSVNIPFRFQGQYYDEESGLHYNRFRYYDPEIGRFISQDPIGLWGGDNLYVYAPNTTGWTDPMGLKSEWQKNWEARYGMLPAGYQVHHIIPKEEMVLASVRKLCSSYNIHNPDNLIALPTSSSVPQQNKSGFGKTIHNGYHKGYSLAAKKLLDGAIKFNKPGLSSCTKFKAVQGALKTSLVKGDMSMYKSDAQPNISNIMTAWITSSKQNIRNGN